MSAITAERLVQAADSGNANEVEKELQIGADINGRNARDVIANVCGDIYSNVKFWDRTQLP